MTRQPQIRHSLLLLVVALTFSVACGSDEPITPKEFCEIAPARFLTVSIEFDDIVATTDSVNRLNVTQTTQKLEQSSVRLNNLAFDLSAVPTNIQPSDGDSETYAEFAERFDDHTVKMIVASTSMKGSIRRYRDGWDVDDFNRFVGSLAEVHDNAIGAYNNMAGICALAGVPIE
ncbi:MAG: hypothetical protein OXE87_14000 [Chloroflexi bacterium]|nr:hypothetical protein [Chloroflexota bacterium]